ncbi:MAG: serine/threonine protein kinase, partial [Solirubrobacterales bacterium]|nr:serine/threonine protein kinase [Solirubrobacterales bacterium]
MSANLFDPDGGQVNMMNATEWQQIKAIVQQALDINPEQRTQFVAQQCAADPSLRDEVIAFLKADQTLGDFISQPAYLSFVGNALSNEVEDLRIGERLGRYEIEGELGRGGMGTVYLARDEELNRKVALKILPAQLYRHPGSTERFRREAHIISALNHPNVLTIHEIGRADSIDFIATEFVDGITLRQRITAGGVTIREAADVGSQVMAALAAAHAAGFIHRDVKPENIIIRVDGLVKVLDFGIAKLNGSQDTSSESTPVGDINFSIGAGTPRYMSPEQLRGDALDPRSDIWSFGAVLFELLTGQPPGDDYET